MLPRPGSATAATGTYELTAGTGVVETPGTAGMSQVVRELLTSLRLPLPTVAQAGATGAAGAVTLHLEPTSGTAESYRLRVHERGVDIVVATVDGLVNALHTLRQLLPDDTWRAAPRAGTRWVVGCGEVTDAPALTWRGAMLDVARHFFPKRTLLRYVDLLAMHRYNRLHLHLTDDQGWRIESRRHPKVHRVGSHRPATQLGRDRKAGRDDGTPHGGYYTLDDLAEIHAYAQERGVTLVPEIDLPGHSSALLAARPELGVGEHRVLTGWGISGGVLKPLPATVEFVAELLDELLEAVPTPYVHLGGDECVITDWASDPEVSAYQEELGLAAPIDLHGHFLRALGSHLKRRGARMVVWDEAFVTGGLLDDSIVMAWRGDSVARRAAGAGYDVVRTPVYPTYLNYDQSDLPEEPMSQGGPITLPEVAAFEPVPADWSPAERSRVLGLQFQAWTEYIASERHLDYLMFPRASVLADVAWNGRSSTAAGADGAARTGGTGPLEAHLDRLTAAGVEYRPADGPHPWQGGGTGDRRRQSGSTMAAEIELHERISEHGDVGTASTRST
nr:beta-N-acetylhexosaminidase [Actinopolymorpha cephalotaxi]